MPSFNPDTQEDYYSVEVASRLPLVLQELWVIWLILSIVALFLIRKRHAYVFSETQFTDSGNEYGITLVIYDKRFCFLYIMNFCSIFYSYFVWSCFKVFGQSFIKDDHFLSMVGSVAAFCNGMRFLWSVPLDYGYTYK